MAKKQSTLNSWIQRPRLSTVVEESSPVPDWFLNSNIRQLVQNYIEERFHQECQSDKNLHQEILRRFYKYYTKRPVSRRSPHLRLNELILMPSLVPPDMNAICFQHQVLIECFVDMSKNNFYMLCENKAYDMIMRRDEKVRNGLAFPTSEKLTETTLLVYHRNSSKFLKKLKRRSNKLAGTSSTVSIPEKESQLRKVTNTKKSPEKSTAAPLSVEQEKSEEEGEENHAEMLKNFYDDYNYSLPSEAMKSFRKKLRKIWGKEDSGEGFVGNVPVAKPKRRLVQEPEEEVSRCDKNPDETPVDKSPVRKKPKRRIEDSPAMDSSEPKTPEKHLGEDALCVRNFLSDNFQLELNVSASYFEEKMKENEAGAATPSRKSPAIRSPRATIAVSPKVSPQKRPDNENLQRQPTLLDLTSFNDIFNDNEELAIPKRKKTFEGGSQNVLSNAHNYSQKRLRKRKTTAAPLQVKLRRIEEAKRRGVLCEEEESALMNLDRETSEMDCECTENPQWLEDFLGDAALEMDMSPSYFTGCSATAEVPPETESLSQEIAGALISSTPADRSDYFIVVLREDSEAAVQGHAAVEKRLHGGIIDEILDIPCDRKSSDAESTNVETEERNVGENLEGSGEVAEIPPIVPGSQAEEDVNVTQDIFQTQVSSGGSWETVMEDEVSLFDSESRDISTMDEEGLFSEVQSNKQSTVALANEVEISTEKISENNLENVQMPLITWLHNHLLDNDVEIVGTEPAEPGVVIFVEDLSQGTPFPDMSQDPLVSQLSQILGV